MSDAFDPYYSWLGIPPREQPVDYYRLLGIVLYEDNPEVIENAADRQMAHLHTRQLSKHADLSQRLLNEVAMAKVCLANPERKAAYDDQLRKMGKKPLVHRPTPWHGSVPTPIQISPTVERPAGNRPQPLEIEVESPESLRQQRAESRKKRSLITAGVLLISGGVVWAGLWPLLSNLDLAQSSVHAIQVGDQLTRRLVAVVRIELQGLADQRRNDRRQFREDVFDRQHLFEPGLA